MACMKCGRNTDSSAVFCDSCLQEMEKYPVEPDIEVKLPQRKSPSQHKKPTKKRGIPLEEQIKVLKKRCRILLLLLIAVTILAALLAVPAVEHILEDQFKIGQNYSTITSSDGS